MKLVEQEFMQRTFENVKITNQLFKPVGGISPFPFGNQFEWMLQHAPFDACRTQKVIVNKKSTDEN